MRWCVVVFALVLVNAAHAAGAITGEWSFTASFDWRPMAACSVTVGLQTGVTGTCEVADDVYAFAIAPAL
jgi:hypothetical protein